MIKNHSRFEALRDFTIDSGKEDSYSARSSTEARDDDLASLASDTDAEATTEISTSQQSTLSERARGKQPINLHTSETASDASEIVQQPPLTSIQANPSFKPTPEWVSDLPARSLPSNHRSQKLTLIPSQLHTWQPYLELHRILQITENGLPTDDGPPSVAQARQHGASPSTAEEALSGATAPRAAQHADHGGEKTPARRVGFKWTSQALGWYLSVLWGLVYAADAAMNRGSSGVWTGTNMKLFNVVSQREQVSLRSPKGAVDAAGDAIARRISNFSFGSNAAASPTMREV